MFIWESLVWSDGIFVRYVQTVEFSMNYWNISRQNPSNCTVGDYTFIQINSNCLINSYFEDIVHFLSFKVHKSFCYHSTINKKFYETVFISWFQILKNWIFDLIFDTHDNPGIFFKIYKWVWNFFIPHLLVWTGAENTSKTQHFCCVLQQKLIRKPPDFFKWGG